MTDISSHLDQASSYANEYAKIENLFHLVASQTPEDEKIEASVHPLANLDALMGAHRGPAIDPELLKTNPRVCIACGVDFKSRASLHAHLTRHRHILGTLEGYLRLPKYECRSCEGIINCSSMLKHKCYSKQQTDIKNRVKSLDKDGSPFICILCRGRVLPSRTHLIIHIMVAHSVHRDPLKCVFCHAKFDSENLMMQEVHAFDCHAPELFMITHKACYKIIRTQQGNVADATVPFTCFYDNGKLQGADVSDLFRSRLHPNWDSTGGSEVVDQIAALNNTRRRACTLSFTSIDEYVTHLCCVHGSVDVSILLNKQEKTSQDEIKNTMNKSSRIPGPTVSELLKSQTAGHHTTNKSTEDEFSPPSLGLVKFSHPARQNRGKVQQKQNPQLRIRDLESRSLKTSASGNQYSRAKEICRVCLDTFQEEAGFSKHMTFYHAAENKKRLRHLAEKGNLSGVLNIDLICTECYITYPDNLSLQVHMMVSHASKDWRHCGLCSYEFFSENGGTPNHLRFVSFDGTQLDSSSVISSNTEAWPLPAELMWRMIVTHETRHRERLFPPRQVPFLPLILIDQLTSSRAIQAGMAANWLMKRAKEEIEGAEAAEDAMHGPTTAQEAFLGSGAKKARLLQMDANIASEARTQLIELIRGGNADGTNEESLAKLPTQASRAYSQRPSSYMSQAFSKLPIWLARQLAELGERNAARQVDLDFAENL